MHVCMNLCIYIIYIYTHHIYIYTSYIYICKCIQVQMYTSTNVYKYKCICTSRIVYTVYISLYSLPVRKIPLRRSCCAGNHPFGAITMSNCAGRGCAPRFNTSSSFASVKNRQKVLNKSEISEFNIISKYL